MIEAAVGDVLDDHLAGVESFGGGLGRVLLHFVLHDLVYGSRRVRRSHTVRRLPR